MPTRNLWRPGFKPEKTPAGRETQVPEAMEGKELAAHLSELDSVFETDPEQSSLLKRNEGRRARWNRQQAPLRAFNRFYQELPDDENKPSPYTSEYQALYAAYMAAYRHPKGHDFAKDRLEKEAPPNYNDVLTVQQSEMIVRKARAERAQKEKG